MSTSDEQVILDYPETMEVLLQESVNLLSSLIGKDNGYYVTVSQEIAIMDFLNICAELGWKPSE